jgi:hypothetical protein
MRTSMDYTKLAASLDYAALEKKRKRHAKRPLTARDHLRS